MPETATRKNDYSSAGRQTVQPSGGRVINGSKSGFTSKYAKSYTTFSGTDMVCIAEIPKPKGNGSIVQPLGEVQTITYSIHDEKTPVRCIGDMNPKVYVFGPRTIAGTIVFTVFDQHWAKKLQEQYLKEANAENVHMLSDELPPVNLTLSFANEYGNKARLAIYGVTFVNEGQVMSINDMYLENSYQFYAMDLDYMTPVNATTKSAGSTKKTGTTYPKETADKDTSTGTGNTQTESEGQAKTSVDPPKAQTANHNDTEEEALRKIKENLDKSNADVDKMLAEGKITAEKAEEIKANNQRFYQENEATIKAYYAKQAEKHDDSDDTKAVPVDTSGTEDTSSQEQNGAVAKAQAEYVQEIRRLSQQLKAGEITQEEYMEKARAAKEARDAKIAAAKEGGGA